MPLAIAIPTMCAPYAFAPVFYDFLASDADLRSAMLVILVVTVVVPRLWFILRPLRVDPALTAPPSDTTRGTPFSRGAHSGSPIEHTGASIIGAGSARNGEGEVVGGAVASRAFRGNGSRWRATRAVIVGVVAGLFVAAGATSAAAATNGWPTRQVAGVSTSTGGGYWTVRANGTVETAYYAHNYGGASGVALSKPITGMAATPTSKGYWLVAGDGGIFTFGDAHFYGSTGNLHLNKPVFSMAPTKDGRGYWLVASDGGIFAFGDAKYYGSLGGRRLNQPIVGITATPSGKGYVMVARDGGIFTFGDAVNYGSLAGFRLTDVVGMARTPTGKGYWILRKLGSPCLGTVCPNVYNFGDAQQLPWFLPAAASFDFVNDPVVGLIANPTTQGYVMLRATGDDAFSGNYPGCATVPGNCG